MHTMAMNTNRSVKFLTLLTTILLGALVANASEVAPEPVRVFILDDQTGEELLRDHGIHPLCLEDLIVLLDTAIQGTTPVAVFHQPVDEDSADNPVTNLRLDPFAGGPPPMMPSGHIPVHQFQTIKRTYDKRRAEWQRSILAYRQEVLESTEFFVRRVGEVQTQVAHRFDTMLAAHNGRDFNRSDIVGAIETANRVLGTGGRRILVLNTDADDLPGPQRRPRRTPLTAGELDPGIELLFVNSSRLPQQNILFSGIPNKVRHASMMKEAMRELAKEIADSNPR
jgi:hypothetical protein